MSTAPTASSSSLDAADVASKAPPPRPRPIPAVVLGSGLLLLYAAHLAIYRAALSAKPSADDFILSMAVRLGESLGPLHFFLRSPLADYRPVQWIVAWAAARGSLSDPFPALHALGFACFAFYAAVFLLWTRRLGLGLVATWAAAGFVFLHPVLAGPVAEADGFTRCLVSALVWLGVYLADRYSDRLAAGLPLVAACLAVGLMMMEYAVGLLLLAPIAVYCRRSRRRLAGAVLTAASLGCVLVAYLWIRSSVVGPGDPLISLQPLVWLENVAMLSAACLFFGNTAQVALAPGWRAAATLALGCLCTLGWIVAGVGARLGLGLGLGFGFGFGRGVRRSPAGDLPCLALLAAAAFAPMFAMRHVSEIYATAPLFAIGLLVGWAAEGWRRLRGGWLGFAALAVLLVWGAHSTVAKVRAIGTRGERTALQVASLLAEVPATAHTQRVALVFPERGPSYSVFVAGDDLLIQPGRPARYAAEWLFPGRDVRLTHVVGTGPAPATADLVLCWDPPRARFLPSRGAPCPSPR